MLVVHAAPAMAQTGEHGLDPAAERALALLLEDGLPVRQAVGLAERLTGAPRKRLYAAALAMRDAGPADEAPSLAEDDGEGGP